MSHLQRSQVSRRSGRRFGLTRVPIAVVAAGLVIALGLPAASAEVPQAPPSAKVMKSPISRQKPVRGIDFANAIPMALPQAKVRPAPWPEIILNAQQAPTLVPPRVRPGAVGTGELMPVSLVPERQAFEEPTSDRSNIIAPQEFGTGGLPYTTSQVNAFGDDTDLHFPFAAAGKVFFNDHLGQTFVCSASLIGRGIAVTAAHCVAEFGARRFYSNWQFVPAYNNGRAPFGVSTARQAFLMPSWFDGTDPCAAGPGIACLNDIAVVVLNPVNGVDYVGSFTGWLAVGADWYGFTPSGTTQVTQLAYPQGLDGGVLMERTDSFGYVDPNLAYNTIIGSLMKGGSSGGPWVLNLGMPPSLSGTDFGQAAVHNVVVGVTSWGVEVPDEVKLQASSPFVSGNVFALLTAACATTPSACQ